MGGKAGGVGASREREPYDVCGIVGAFGWRRGLRRCFNFPMKTKLLVSSLFSSLLFLATVCGVFGQGRVNGSSGGDPVAVVESENRMLARAYVQAFGSLVRPPFTLTLQKENVGYVLEDVRGIKDVGGILIVEVGRGFNYVVNPKDIVAISDGPAVKGDR